MSRPGKCISERGYIKTHFSVFHACMQREEDDDVLPFVSRPKKVKVMRVAPGDAKPTTTSAGATSTYNEILDGDTEAEAGDPVPETRLEGDLSA